MSSVPKISFFKKVVEIIGCEYFSGEANDEAVLYSAFKDISLWPSPQEYLEESNSHNHPIMKLKLFDQTIEVLPPCWLSL